NGANGKMGQETVKAILEAGDLELVGQNDIGDNLAESIKETGTQVVVDFTTPAVVYKNVKTILNAKAHAVVGTTGLSDGNLAEIKKLCAKNKVNCLVAPNFAIGAVLMMKFAKEAAHYMPQVEIIELHHDKKIDAPSGTAKKTAEMIKGESKGIKDKKIPIHSVRLQGLVAHQEVIFGGLGQTLTIRHDSISRESFMPGVIMAIRKISGSGKKIKGLVLGLDNLL
ncbi:MAG: 4-hydroxy-tetrahydrodipicolinate reductase, partial [bacterium]